MSVLCDSQLIELCEEKALVTPFDVSLINPASIDLRVGFEYRFEKRYLGPSPTDTLWDEPVMLGDGYLLKYGETILLDTLEYVNIPIHCMAEMWLKSSAGRNGLDIYKAGYIDPGFHGTLTFRLTNNMHRPFFVQPGQRLVQMVVREMSKIPKRSYIETGRYNGQIGPTIAR